MDGTGKHLLSLARTLLHLDLLLLVAEQTLLNQKKKKKNHRDGFSKYLVSQPGAGTALRPGSSRPYICLGLTGSWAWGGTRATLGLQLLYS